MVPPPLVRGCERKRRKGEAAKNKKVLASPFHKPFPLYTSQRARRSLYFLIPSGLQLKGKKVTGEGNVLMKNEETQKARYILHLSDPWKKAASGQLLPFERM
jgi:hypothetical protein